MAAIGAAAIGAGATIYASSQASKASKQAANTQAAAADAAVDAQLNMFYQSRADQLPFIQAAQNLLPGAQKVGQAAYDLYPKLLEMAQDYKASPLTQLQLKEGSKQINQQLMARGLYNSGAGIDAQSQFAQRVLANQADKQWSQLAQVYGAGVGTSPLGGGMNTATALAGQSVQTGSGLASTYMAGGNNQAQLQYAMGQQRANMYTGIGNQAMSLLGNYFGSQTPTYTPSSYTPGQGTYTSEMAAYDLY